MTEREAFGLELRRARERRGLTLEEVCVRTKVSIAHYSGLERGDISHWPSGIFRRAFLRCYAGVVGLDAEVLVAEFGRLFPDPADTQRSVSNAAQAGKEPEWPAREAGPTAGEAGRDEADGASTLRLVLDSSSPLDESSRAGVVARRVLAGAIDVLLPLASAAVLAFLAGPGWFWFAAALVGLIGHVGFYGFTGSTPGTWLLRRSRGLAPSPTSDAPVRRRSDLGAENGARRHVPRLPTSRPAGHARRVRH